MGTVKILNRTTIDPLTCIGEMAGICWDAPIDDAAGNYKRGMDCVNCDHGRTMEYPQIYMVLDGWSAKCIREFYTHIGGSPTRLQASTRYINYANQFGVVVPDTIAKNEDAKGIWDKFMESVPSTIEALKDAGVPTEDATNALPLAYKTKVVVRTNLRNLIDMSHQRLCSRAYWEFRELMKEIIWALENYSEEWEALVYDAKVFVPKCEVAGFCKEKKSCGRKPKKQQ